jgi:hypothetical protein
LWAARPVLARQRAREARHLPQVSAVVLQVAERLQQAPEERLPEERVAVQVERTQAECPLQAQKTWRTSDVVVDFFDRDGRVDCGGRLRRV